MEEERKVITIGNPGELNNNLEIPEMKLPETVEQLQQQYNSEEWEKLKESLTRAWEGIKEYITPIVEAVAKVVKDTYKIIMEAYSIDPEIKKCYRIYKRTKKRKD